MQEHNVFIQEFNSVEDVIKEYNAPNDALSGATIHLAWYGYGSYCGSSLVIFEKDGTLYEVNGGHCSCHGLEDQWSPEETTWEILNRRDYTHDGCDGSQEAHEALHALTEKHLRRKETQYEQ